MAVSLLHPSVVSLLYRAHTPHCNLCNAVCLQSSQPIGLRPCRYKWVLYRSSLRKCHWYTLPEVYIKLNVYRLIILQVVVCESQLKAVR